jgi:hypothetical protein
MFVKVVQTKQFILAFFLFRCRRPDVDLADVFTPWFYSDFL